MQFMRMTPDEYGNCQTSRIASLDFNIKLLVAILGEPFYNSDNNFPDDNSKVDVCWGIKNANYHNEQICVWNYKNGPAYTGNGSIDYIHDFSVWHNSESFFATLLAELKCAARMTDDNDKAPRFLDGLIGKANMNKFIVSYKTSGKNDDKVLVIEAVDRVEAVLTAFDHLSQKGLAVAVTQLGKFDPAETKRLSEAKVLARAGRVVITFVEEYKVKPTGKVIG